MGLTANTVFRDFVTDGVETTGLHAPAKAEVRSWGTGLETAIAALAGTGGKLYATKAAMDADLSPAANTPAIVRADSTAANNGLYTKSGGTGTGSWTLVSSVIPGEKLVTATATSGGTANALAATTDFAVTSNSIVILTIYADNTGSPVTVQFNGAGTVYTIKNVVGADIPVGVLKAGMRVIGAISGSTLRLATDTTVIDQGRAIWGLENALPSATRDVKLCMVEPGRVIIEMRPQNAAYRDGYTRRYDDVVRWEMMNLNGRYHTGQSTPHVWTPISAWSRFKGVWVPHVNYSWDALVGAEVDTGQTFSIFDPVLYIGKSGDSLASINSPGSGPGHGRINATGFNLLVNGAVRDGTTLSDGTDLRDSLRVGQIITATQVDFFSTWQYLTPDGSVGATVSHLIRFSPDSGHQVTSLCSIAYTSAFTVLQAVGYYQMLPLRLANRVQARNTSHVLSSVVTVGLGANAVTSFALARRVTGWHTDHVGHCMEMEVNAAYVPFRRNGVAATYSEPMFVIDNLAGPKIYGPIAQDSGTTDDETGNTITTLGYYNCVMANTA